MTVLASRHPGQTKISYLKMSTLTNEKVSKLMSASAVIILYASLNLYIYIYIYIYTYQTCCNYLPKVIITIPITSWKQM